jgi:hypothetical protein
MPWKAQTVPTPERQIEALKQELLKADAMVVALKHNYDVATDFARRAHHDIHRYTERLRDAARHLCADWPTFQTMQLGGSNPFLTMDFDALLDFLTEALDHEHITIRNKMAQLERSFARKEQALSEALAWIDQLSNGSPDSSTPSPDLHVPASPPPASSTIEPEPSPTVETIASASLPFVPGKHSIASSAVMAPPNALPQDAPHAPARTTRGTADGDARLNPIKPSTPAPSALANATMDTAAQTSDEAINSMDAMLQWFFSHLVKSGYGRYREVLADEAIITKMTQRTIYARLTELRNTGLITVESTIRVTRSRHYQIFSTTPLGRLVYRQLSGEDPPLNLLERLRINHDNPTHGFVIYDTADILAGYGWECSIDRMTNQITFSNKTQFIPDLVAQKPSQIPGDVLPMRMIEVEMGTTRPQDFVAKCDKMYAATRKLADPSLYFVTVAKPVLDQLINQFSEWAVMRKRPHVQGRFATVSMLEESDQWTERHFNARDPGEGAS